MTQPQRRSGWLLLVAVLIPYLFIKLAAWTHARQANQLEAEINQLRPALSAIVLSEQLEKTREACEKLTQQVRGLDLENGRLLELLSHLPASITLTSFNHRARLNVPLHNIFAGTAGEVPLKTDLWIEGKLLPGDRNPELVLVRWAETLRDAGVDAEIKRLAPSPNELGIWLFELRMGDA